MGSYRDKKGDEDEYTSVFHNLDKSTVLQETRYFNSTPVNPTKCIQILTKILYLLNQGDKLSIDEATDMFFATTKLFQLKDVSLRRLVYLCIKELSPLAKDVIIVTSSLTKDVTGTEDLYKTAAIRTLCSITDSTMLQSIERYMKQAIVDKNPAISSAALVSALHLSASVPDLVKRWVNEAQEAIRTADTIVSYHAIGFVASIRKNDRLSLVKLVSKLIGSPLRSPYACSLVIRFCAKFAEEDTSEASEHYVAFIESCLRHKSEIVVYEAAHAIINLKRSPSKLAETLSILQIFCSSSKAAQRLAGARTIAKLTAKHPDSVINSLTRSGTLAVTLELENLISDQNRTIATLAVTTLLATGAESSIDRLMKPMASFISEIPDEFKIIVVRAIRRLCLKYPRKHRTLLTFLASMLREEGGLLYKTAIADAIVALIKQNPEAKEAGLAHLCEFIEDCEYVPLAVSILHVLGQEGPKTRHPSRYIRYIYNRVILESEPVRAAAVSAVARFGAACADLLSNIKVLLSRWHLDENDEVRDRAIFYGEILDSGDRNLINDFILNVRVPNIVHLETALQNHLKIHSSEPFNLNEIPAEENIQEVLKETDIETTPNAAIPLEELYFDQLKVITGIEKFGTPFKTCAPIDLTEPETEYRVKCVKHIYVRHLILQFECYNTLSDQILQDVHVRLDIAPGYKLLGEISCPQLTYEKPGYVFSILEFPENPTETIGTFGATLEFIVRNCEENAGFTGSSEGYADTYPIEDIDITHVEQFRLQNSIDDWEMTWKKASSGPEIQDTFILPQNDITEAARAVCEHLSLPIAAISGDAVKEIRGSALWRGGIQILIKSRLVLSKGVVTMQMTVRTPRKDIGALFLTAVV